MRPLREMERNAAAKAVVHVAGCAALLALLCGARPAAAGPEILRVRHWTYPSHTRIVLDLSGPAVYEVRRVDDPARIAVNVRSGRFRGVATLDLDDPLISRVRRNALVEQAQVVLDLACDAPYRHFALPAAANKPDRIVLDVLRPEAPATAPAAPAATPAPPPAPSPDAAAAVETVVENADEAAVEKTVEPAVAQAVQPAAPFTVVLDAGHGGLDPGAMRAGVREKDVVLAVALETARLLDQVPGYRVVLTRTGDRTVSLGHRVRQARDEQGDIFVSIHCNTHPRSSTAGMEVYFLSLKGASDRQARELANRENAAHMVGLGEAAASDDDVLSILMDLRMSRVLDRSSRLAEQILTAARGTGVVGARRVKQARFQVLRTLAMPSVLVELAYLSNRDDRRLLQSRSGQTDLARTLVRGILAYRGDREALTTLAAAGAWTRRYRVQRGDTLWDLARRHRTTIARIREENNLRSLQIEAGQLLRLPEVD